MERLVDHWRARPEWTDGARYVTWHLLPAAAPAVVVDCHRALAELPGLDLVPARWLHLTVQGVGPAGSVDVPAVVAAARRRLAGMPAVELVLAPPAAHREGVLLEGTPVEPVAALRTALRAAVVSVRGTVDGAADERVWPHLSLAYANAAVPAAPVRAALAGLPARPTPIRFAEVSLIELRRAARTYVWDRLATVPLG